MNTGAPWPIDVAAAWSRVLAMQTKLHRWAAADSGRRFDDLHNLVYDPAFLVAAWSRVRGNKGARTAGVDRLAPREVIGAGVAELLAEIREGLKSGGFVPQRVREKAIPKASGKVRRLGIPTTADRIVQAALKLVMEPIFEADFQPCSYGFRPRRRAQDAVAEIHYLASPNRNYEWVFEADITACFDEIDHQALMGRVRARIGDKRVLGWVTAFLRAGILTETGVNRETFTGTPQGGILSPLLANIALSVLDEYFAAKWEALGPEWTRVKLRRAGHPVMKLVRYADDFVIMIAGQRGDAEALWDEVEAVLAPMGLRLSVAKSRVCHIDEGFDFLGWRIQRRARRSRSGKTAIYTYPSKKTLASIIDKVRTLTRRAKHRTLADLLRRLNPVLRGWCNYFRHGVSARTFGHLDHYAFWRIVGWLRKRHLRLNKHTLIRGASFPAGRSAPSTSRCSAPPRSPSCATATGAPAYRHHGRAQAEQRHEHVESRMLGNGHVRFGRRAAETDQSKDRHRAAARPQAMSGPKYSKAQKDRFFDLIDRGGTVRAAAKAVGVHEDAAYRWLRQAGLSMQRATPRKYSEADKAEFFGRLAENPNVSAVARELGFTRVTCYSWAYKAGIRTSEARKVNPRREEFPRLRATGLTRGEARARVGADARSATDWDKGITIINRGRVYPDGRVVRYPEPTLVGVVAERRMRAIGGSIDLNKVEKVIDPRYLSLLEHEQIKDLHRAGMSIRQIAAELQRSPSTISRELRRNTASTRGYLPHTAHRLSVARRARPRQAVNGHEFQR